MRLSPSGLSCAGCRFISAYPMSPSTDIITWLNRNEKRFGIFCEQAEDEIAAINMAIGAGFAGGQGHDGNLRRRICPDDGRGQPGGNDRDPRGHCSGTTARTGHRPTHANRPGGFIVCHQRRTWRIPKACAGAGRCARCLPKDHRSIQPGREIPDTGDHFDRFNFWRILSFPT